MSAEYNAKFANTDIATRAIHAGQEPDPTTGAVVTPIFATSTFKQDGVLGLRGGHDYSRSINPTRTSFDEQLAAVEGGKYALANDLDENQIVVVLAPDSGRSYLEKIFNDDWMRANGYGDIVERTSKPSLAEQYLNGAPSDEGAGDGLHN